MSLRNERIAEQIRAELAKLLREEVSDPRIGLVTLTRVKLSPDLSTAAVFWSPLDIQGEIVLEEVSRGFESAAGFLRGRMAAELSLRKTPALSFRYDSSIEEGSRTLALLRSLPELQRDEDEEQESVLSAEDGKEWGEDHGKEG